MTGPGLDLSGVRAVFDLWMEGSTVRVNAKEGAGSAVLNPDTGKLEKPTPAVVHEGPGLIVPLTSSAGRNAPDPAIAVLPADPATTHRLLLPLGVAATIRVGHRVVQATVNPSMGDVAVTDVPFRVTEVPDSSAIAVLRVVFLKADTDASR